jgi:hypothetical protein
LYRDDVDSETRIPSRISFHFNYRFLNGKDPVIDGNYYWLRKRLFGVTFGFSFSMNGIIVKSKWIILLSNCFPSLSNYSAASSDSFASMSVFFPPTLITIPEITHSSFVMSGIVYPPRIAAGFLTLATFIQDVHPAG